MRFELFKIGDYQLHAITGVTISRAARNRNVSTNLNGDLLIDQSAIKRKISVNMAICSQQDMAVIEDAVNSALVEITFMDGAEQVTITATLASCNKDKPIYKYGNIANGLYYTGVKMQWEER